MENMKHEDVYPDMDGICRLCLKENTGTITIFSDQSLEASGNQTHLSIPMRIMACAALEVQPNDGLPKKICAECRFQLEKSYLFRKQSQASDTKLRKHIRLLALGKSSKVFRKKNSDEDDDDDELEFYDSLEFIREHDEKIKIEEQKKLNELEAKLKEEYEKQLETSKEQIKAKCKEELRAEVEEKVRTDLRQELHEEIENEVVPQIRMECMEDAKKTLREEMREECRRIEKKALLDDLQCYLKERNRSYSETADESSVPVTQKIVKIIPGEITRDDNANKRKIHEIMPANPTKKSKYNENKKETTVAVKSELMLTDTMSDMDDRDSDNFLIYDTDEGFEVQKKTTALDGEGGDEDEDQFDDDQIQAYDSSEDQIVHNNGQENQTTSTISYSIADPESCEITFLKKSHQIQTHNDSNYGNEDSRLHEDDIMIINYPDEIVDEEHLDTIDYGNDDKDVKSLILKNQQYVKHYKPIKNANNIGNVNTFTTTKSTVETTLTTKTYINTTQRVTDTPKMFKCNECPMEFTTNHSLERHNRIHQREGATFQCNECQIVVSCSSALRRHMYIHSEEKPFRCTECDKAFVQKEILKRHMQTHTGIKPHKCPHCDREFAQRINLKSHINRHHVEEPRIQQHSCHLCPKRFNHASGLSRHLASHSGVAFQCSECDRTFGDRSSIKRHIANKHGSGQIAKSEKN